MTNFYGYGLYSVRLASTFPTFIVANLSFIHLASRWSGTLPFLQDSWRWSGGGALSQYGVTVAAIVGLLEDAIFLSDLAAGHDGIVVPRL